jgi:hypothetical protein
MVNSCGSCHRRPSVLNNDKCESCLKFKHPCSRCGRREAFNDGVQQFGRCEPCLNYAAIYQRKKTEMARKQNRCIVCFQPSELARCENHSRSKNKVA